MDLSFKSKKLKKRLTQDQELLKSYGRIAKKIKQRMKELKAAENLAVIQAMPSLRLHPYGGGRRGEWSIDIHRNWRICFKIGEDPIPCKEDGGVSLENVHKIHILSVEDPH